MVQVAQASACAVLRSGKNQSKAKFKTTQAVLHSVQDKKPVLPRVILTRQVRAVPLRFLQRFVAAPAANFLMISAEENFGNRPAAEFCWARVVREVEEKV